MSWNQRLTFWLLWVIFTSCCASLALFLAGRLVSMVLSPELFPTDRPLGGDNVLPHLLVWGCGLLLFLGPSIGLGQGLAIKFSTGRIKWQTWAWMTIVGVEIALLVLVVVSIMVHPLIGAAIPGLILGITQVIAFPPDVRGSYIWIVLSGAGWILAAALGPFLASIVLPSQWRGLPFHPFEAVSYYALGGWITFAIFAIITGGALIWIVSMERRGQSHLHQQLDS
jgi:hypothetical protein